MYPIGHDKDTVETDFGLCHLLWAPKQELLNNIIQFYSIQSEM